MGGTAAGGDEAPVAAAVLEEMPLTIAALPEPARSVASEAWQNYGEIVVVEDREEACKVSDDYAPEHLHIQAQKDYQMVVKKQKNYFKSRFVC